MKKGYNQNNLLGGLSVDRDAFQSQENTLTDAINMTINPEDGNKFVYQTIKSTVPESSIHQSHYNKLTHVIEMNHIDVFTSKTKKRLYFKTDNTYSVTTNVATLTSPIPHSLATGMPVTLNFTTGGAIGKDGDYTVTVLTTTTYTVPIVTANTSGIVYMSTPKKSYNVKIKEGYFVLTDNIQGIDEIAGKQGYNVQIQVRYLLEGAFTTSPYALNLDLQYMSPGDRIPLNINPDLYISDLEVLTTGFTISGYQLGYIEYFGEDKEIEESETYLGANVGPTDNKVILGTKTFNDITYFIIGDPDFISATKSFRNNIGVLPIDHWNNTDVSVAKFKPGFIEGDAVRDEIKVNVNLSKTKTINVPNRSLGSFESEGGSKTSTGHAESGVVTSSSMVTIEADGTYSFDLTLRIDAPRMVMKDWMWINGAGRLYVKRDGASYNTYNRKKPLYGHDWDVLCSSIGDDESNGFGVVRLKNLLKGDQVFVQMIGAAETKQSFGIELIASLRSDTTFPIFSESISALSIDALNITTVPASSNLHSNGQVELSMSSAMINLVAGYGVPVSIDWMDFANAIRKEKEITISFTREKGYTGYVVQGILHDNPNYVSSQESDWKTFTTLEDKGIGLISISKSYLKDHWHGASNTNFLWIRIAPISLEVRGAWIGGYHTFRADKSALLGNIKFDVDFITQHSVDAKAVDPITGSWATGVLPPEKNKASYAIDYSDFIPFLPDHYASIHGLPPGTHTVYVMLEKTGAPTEYAKKIIVIGGEASFGTLEMDVRIDMSGNKSVSDFNLLVKVTDPTGPKSTFNVVVSPYTPLTVAEIEIAANVTNPLCSIVASGETVTIPITGKMFKEGNLYVYAINENTTDQMNIGGLVYNSGKYTNGENKYYKRISQGIVLIEENSSNNRFNLEIGSFPSPYYNALTGSLLKAYQPLQNLNGGAFITPRIKLSGNNYVDVDIQPVYDGSVNIIYTDGELTPRIVNSGFAALGDSQYELINSKGGKDTNTYSDSTVEVATRLVQTEGFIPTVSIDSVNSSGGNLEVGMYKFLFKLSTIDGNDTGFIAETGSIPIFFGDTLGSIQGGALGDRTKKSLDITLRNVDSFFNHVVVYIDHASGVNQKVGTLYKIDKQYLIPSSSSSKSSDVAMNISGFEGMQIVDRSILDTQKMPISSIKSVAQVQDRLFVANFTHEDIDYVKLFDVGTKILVAPSFGLPRYPMVNFMGAWPGNTDEDTSLLNFSYKFLTTHLTNFSAVDWNLKDTNSMSDVMDIAGMQGHHNPLFTERYAAYWPKETYVYNAVFVTHDNYETRPIPIIGGDYSSVESVGNGETMAELILEEYIGLPQKFTGDMSTNWMASNKSGSNVNFNKLGVCRFPNQVKSNTVFYPSFKFSIDQLNEAYPGFINKFKGFFFTRAERRQDVIMQGFVGPVLATLTDKVIYRDEDPDAYVPKKENAIDEFTACIPALYKGYGILAYEYPKALNDGIGWGIGYEHHAGAFVTVMDGSSKEDYTDNYSPETSWGIYRNWFKSGDMFADFKQAASDFNGKTYGLVMIAEIAEESYTTFKEESNISPYVTTLGNIAKDDKPVINYLLQAIKSNALGAPDAGTTFKVTPNFLPYGVSSKSAGGFSSLIPFRSLTQIVTNGVDPDKQKIFTYLTGEFSEYVGLSRKPDQKDNFKSSLPDGVYNIYPNVDGAIDAKTLQTIYGYNEDKPHIAITPRYSFNDFNGNNDFTIYASRGDCFVTTTIHNIAKSLSAVSGTPTSNKKTFKSLEEGSSEPNSYRGSDASMALMVTHASNFLNYARHNEVIDEKEAILYGGARTFLPLSGNADNILATHHTTKGHETTAFNLGFADNFLGKKFYSISGASPYYLKKGSNTVAFSNAISRQSFYNAYRTFILGDSKNYSSDMGEIQKLVEFRNNLLIVHSHGVSRLGINTKALVGGESGEEIYATSGDILPDKPVSISTDFGSKWARSVHRTDNFVYGIDVDRGKIWRTTGEEGSMEIISDNIIESLLKGFLFEMKGQTEIPGERYVATFSIPHKKEVIFSIYNKESTHPNFALPMDPDIYFFLNTLYTSLLRVSPGDTVRARELLYHWAEEGWYIGTGFTSTMSHLEREDRIAYVELYLDVILTIVPETNSQVNSCLTLIFAEEAKVWVSRLSVAPEFLFTHKGTTYSIANKQDMLSLPSSTLKFKEDIEMLIIADKLVETKRAKDKLYDTNDIVRRLIWKHEGFDPAIPRYGSFYGKGPISEIEIMVASEPAQEKTFEVVSIIGSHSTPSVILLTMSPDNPLLNKVMGTPEYATAGWTTWSQIEDAYFDHFGFSGDRKTTNPAMFFKQYVRDRRFNSISRANSLYANGKTEITISKGLQPMYISQNAWERLKFRYLQDKYIKIRFRYDSGEDVRIQTIGTAYSY